MSQRLVLFAKTILTMDRPQPIEDGFVLIQGSRVLQVGRREDLYFTRAVRMLDLGDTLLLPGFINAHCHLDFTLFKGKVKYRGGFREWLRQMAVKSRETTPSEFRKSIQKGIEQSLVFGTTTLCDVASSWESYPLLRKSALRSFVFFEMIDMAQPSTQQYWKNFQQRLKALLRQVPPTDTCGWGLSPHTPFTVSKELFQMVKQFLDHHRDILTTIHVGESWEESRYFKKGSGPMADRIKVLNPHWTIPHSTTPVQYLSQNGWMPKLNLGVHLNEVNAKDLKSLAKNRIAAVHCPGSHAYFGHKPFPYKKIKKMKIPVSLGTDSLASNQSLSLFREMRLFQKKHPEVSSQEVLSMVTVKPAQALDRGGELGQVKPGYLADFIGIPMPPSKKQKQNLYDYVVNYKKPVSFSMVNGEPKLRLAETLR
jgi:cytosine/adenosine deaminase-related metal-dependent hydrolase